MNTASLISDIPHNAAQAAYSGVSFTPEKRASQERESYAAQLTEDYEHLQSLIANKPELQNALASEFERYRQGYRARLLKKLASDSRCVSWMITGPANFPTRRNEKRNNVARKRLEELIEFRKRALAAITKTLCPELRPIMAGDANAVESLEIKLAKAEKLQGQMKECNAAIRQHAKAGPDAQVAALVALGYVTDAQARKLLKPDFVGRIGFADYELTNNGANIRRMQKRLEGLKRAKAAPVQQVDGANARLEDCPADNRVRLFFPGKPESDVRERLKHAGFRWTPSLGCWQAYRNHNSMQVAKQEAL